MVGEYIIIPVKCIVGNLWNDSTSVTETTSHSRENHISSNATKVSNKSKETKTCILYLFLKGLYAEDFLKIERIES